TGRLAAWWIMGLALGTAFLDQGRRQPTDALRERQCLLLRSWLRSCRPCLGSASQRASGWKIAVAEPLLQCRCIYPQRAWDVWRCGTKYHVRTRLERGRSGNFEELQFQGALSDTDQVGDVQRL